MGLPRATLPAFALAVAALYPCHRVLADGKYFRLLEVADEPGVRAQRAVLVFKDGVETLLVQSDVQGRGSSLGWVLPLPAEPTAVEACQPHCLSWLGRVIQPKIQEVVLWPLLYAALLLAIVTTACIARLRYRQGERPRPLQVVMGILMGLLFLALSLPSLSRGGLSPGAEVVRTLRAGVYDVSVLRGESADGVLRWLNTNGFACPPSAVPVLRYYVSAGWCFLAAKVAPESDGLSGHHPLRIQFPTKEAVYPLRLTGVDAEPMMLDLFVIGMGRAAARSMHTWVCDSFSSESSYESRFLLEHKTEAPAVFRGDTAGQPIGIPDVCSLMWPGCVLTRLHGRFTASSMTSDLAVRWSEATPMRANLYSRYAAAVSGATVVLVVLSLAIAWGTRTAVRAGWRTREAMRRRFLPGLLVALLAGVIRYGSLEVVTVLDRGNALIPWLAMGAHAEALRDLRERPPDDFFPRAYARLLQESRRRNATFGEKDTLEETGDYHVEASESGWRLTILDHQYVPVTVAISSNGVPQSSE